MEPDPLSEALFECLITANQGTLFRLVHELQREKEKDWEAWAEAGRSSIFRRLVETIELTTGMVGER
jgi:hypothetical protein